MGISTRGPRKLMGAVMSSLLLTVACTPHATPPPPKPPSISVLQVRQEVGGTHYRMLVLGGIWYQTYGSTLLVVNPSNAVELKEIKFGKIGEVGPAIDLAAAGSRLFVVIEDDALVELSIDDPRNPRLLEQHSAGQLGISPHLLSVVNDEVFVSGRGGVVRLSDGSKIFSTPEVAGRVAAADG